MERRLILLGLAVVVIGLFWVPIRDAGLWRHLGKLPGDLSFQSKGISIHFPIVTCLVVSALVSGLAWLYRIFWP